MDIKYLLVSIMCLLLAAAAFYLAVVVSPVFIIAGAILIEFIYPVYLESKGRTL